MKHLLFISLTVFLFSCKKESPVTNNSTNSGMAQTKEKMLGKWFLCEQVDIDNSSGQTSISSMTRFSSADSICYTFMNTPSILVTGELTAQYSAASGENGVLNWKLLNAEYITLQGDSAHIDYLSADSLVLSSDGTYVTFSRTGKADILNAFEKQLVGNWSLTSVNGTAVSGANINFQSYTNLSNLSLAATSTRNPVFSSNSSAYFGSTDGSWQVLNPASPNKTLVITYGDVNPDGGYSNVQQSVHQILSYSDHEMTTRFQGDTYVFNR